MLREAAGSSQARRPGSVGAGGMGVAGGLDRCERPAGPACSERGVWFDEGPHGTCPTTSLASAGVFKTNVPCFVCFF